jgi:hypothetical protein
MTGVALVHSARQAKPTIGPSREGVGAITNHSKMGTDISFISLSCAILWGLWVLESEQ